MRISMMIELNAQRARAEAAALRAEIDQVGKTADAAGRASGSAASGIDRLGTSAQSAGANASAAGDGAQDWARAIDVIRQAINPLEADLVETLREMRNISVAEDIGALTAREAALAHDQLARSVTELRGTIETANAGYDANGAAIARVETAMQRMIAANTGMASSTAESVASELKRGMALDELRARFDPVFAAQRQYELVLLEINEAERQGAISRDVAAVAADRAAQAVRNLTTATTGLAGAERDSVAAQLQHGMALDELRARFDPLFAASRRYELELREINDAERQGALTAAAAGAARERAAAAMAPAVRQIGGAAQSSTAYVAQLGYQVNDIGVMLASGQNPLVLAMQQGTQVNQVFEMMRSQGQSVGQAIRSSLLSMVSPMNLVTLGAIALGAYAVQALMSMREETKTADEAVQDLTGSVEKFASQTRRSTADVVRDFGAINPELAEMQRNLTALAQVKALQDLQATMKSLKGETGSGIYDTAALLGTPAFTAERSVSLPVREFIAGLNELQTAKGPDQALAVIRDLSQTLIAASGGIDQMSEAQAVYYGHLIDSEAVLERLVAAQKEARRQAVEMAIAAGGQNIGMHAALSVDQPVTVDPAQRDRAKRDANELIEAARQENELARLKLVYGQQSAEVRAEEHRQAMAAVEAKITELGIDRQGLQALALRAAEAIKLALAEGQRVKAQQTATDQLRDQYATEARIVALTAKYGADSLEVAYARAAAEREAQVALLESQGIAGAQADELMRGWDAARGIASVNMAAGISEAADVAALLAARLGVSMQNALGLMGIAAGAKNARADSGLSFAIGSPEAAAATPTLGFGNYSGSSYQAPNYDKPKTAGGGKGAETNGVLALIAAQQRELAILREVDPVKQEMLRNSEALAKASQAERTALETLIRTRVAEETALDKVRSAQNELGETGKSLFVGLAEGTMTWVDALDTVLSKLADLAASSVWDMIWNGQGGSGGLGALVTDWLGGSILAKADGGRISGPGGPRDDAIPAWVSNGEYIVNAAATANALPLLEAINAGVPVDRLVAAIGGRPAFASGGLVGVGSSAPASWARADDSNRAGAAASDRPMQVQINNYGSDQIEAKQTTGPDGEAMIAITVGKQWARGMFDRQQKARYGVAPTVARR